jgi:hypothetical protein
MKSAQIGPRPARPWRIVLGIFLILMFVGGTQTINLNDLGAAVGSLVAILLSVAIFLGGGIWLISSGLARR